jgi:hypothetical protein
MSHLESCVVHILIKSKLFYHLDKNIIVILHLLVCSLNEEPQIPFYVVYTHLYMNHIYIYSHEHINLFMYII